MFKFNNNHIFTGYLKQLLASFNLPKCRVYTKELEKQQLNYESKKPAWEATLQNLQSLKAQLSNDLAEITAQIEDGNAELQEVQDVYLTEYKSVQTQINKLHTEMLEALPEIIPTTYHSEYYRYPGSIPEDLPPQLSYPSNMRYNPYIKGGSLQVYANGEWHACHATFADRSKHTEYHHQEQLPYPRIPYAYNRKILNYTKNLQIQNTIYDSYTHEYLGDYLRFHRDFANINLMPLYNCFSNRACPHLDISFKLKNNYEVNFKTDQTMENTLYKYYMVPVKFFKDYTIAIDSEASIEMCCCIYDEYHNKDADFSDVPKLTYQCFGDMQFSRPVLYTKLRSLTDLLINPTNTANDLCQQEDNLKLILKLPANNKSSIVILEGNYTSYNDTVAKAGDQESFLTEHNRTVINYEYADNCEELVDKLITPLQLLRTSTGESYPFADRLVEYLVGNVITVNEEIKDNVVRAKTIMAANCNSAIYPMVAEDGIWEPIMQCLAYDYINNKHNVHDINHDILGFIDKDVEKWYAYTTFKRDATGNIEVNSRTGEPVVASVETIANIDIYNN